MIYSKDTVESKRTQAWFSTLQSLWSWTHHEQLLNLHRFLIPLLFIKRNTDNNQMSLTFHFDESFKYDHQNQIRIGENLKWFCINRKHELAWWQYMLVYLTSMFLLSGIVLLHFRIINRFFWSCISPLPRKEGVSQWR